MTRDPLDRLEPPIAESIRRLKAIHDAGERLTSDQLQKVAEERASIVGLADALEGTIGAFRDRPEPDAVEAVASLGEMLHDYQAVIVVLDTLGRG